MGYETVKAVPTFVDYNHAHQWWSDTKPIRGRSNDLRPLAERRYADCYSIRKNPENQAVECVLYQTPVVTFMPEGEVQVRNNGWATASTHIFIQEVLGTGIRVCGQRGKSIVTVNGSVFSLGNDETLRLRRNGYKYEVLNAQTHYDYKINRRGANNVRSRFSDFYTYLKGFVKLRAQESQGHHYGPMQPMIECSFAELADTLGAKEWWDNSYTAVSTEDWRGLTMKPGTYHLYHKVPKAEYEETVRKFMELIRNDQPEDIKHSNYHKATLALLTYNHSAIVEKKADAPGRTIWFVADKAKETLDTTLFKWFANEVLERYEVPEGKVPSGKYASWIDQENT